MSVYFYVRLPSTVYLPIINKINVVSGVFDVCMISECCGCFDLLRVHGCIYGLTPLHHELGCPLVCRSMGFSIAMFGFEVNVFLGKMEGGGGGRRRVCWKNKEIESCKGN